MTAPHRGFDQGAGYVFRHIARPSLCRVDGDHMQRVIVLPTHHVAHDGVSIGLGGDCCHICDSERAEVAEDEMQFSSEGLCSYGDHLMTGCDLFACDDCTFVDPFIAPGVQKKRRAMGGCDRTISRPRA
jgi:hypothetical protein